MKNRIEKNKRTNPEGPTIMVNISERKKKETKVKKLLKNISRNFLRIKRHRSPRLKRSTSGLVSYNEVFFFLFCTKLYHHEILKH